MSLTPDLLPDIESLRRRTQALAMLDALLSPEWEDRYYSYNAAWFEGQEMASMRNGHGDEWFLLFDEAGAALKGYAHEYSPFNGPALYQAIRAQVPAAFRNFLDEPAFDMEHASFCYWRGRQDLAWSKVSHPSLALANGDDGSGVFLALLVEPASAYCDYALGYFEQEISNDSVQSLYDHTPLTPELVRSIDPDADLSQVRAAADEIGYPVAW
ncbi:hypothetical protein [Lysobacter sp. TAB13]|uniref:hypothetical protein n=1 Tax=Lysobacter sp. TAB13 TaxID=3233065 RepID=UPI003F966A69